MNHACDIEEPYAMMIDHATCMSCKMPGPHASYPLELFVDRQCAAARNGNVSKLCYLFDLHM